MIQQVNLSSSVKPVMMGFTHPTVFNLSSYMDCVKAVHGDLTSLSQSFSTVQSYMVWLYNEREIRSHGRDSHCSNGKFVSQGENVRGCHVIENWVGYSGSVWSGFTVNHVSTQSNRQEGTVLLLYMEGIWHVNRLDCEF